jgi:hypothetical protein
MRALVRTVAALGALALCGCAVNHYRVSMTPVAGGLRRQVACWAEAKSEGEPWRKVAFPIDRLAMVAKAYGKPVPATGEGMHVFDGVFTDAMPDDVGGAGFVGYASTSLGSVWRYAERFGGTPDPLADLERRFRAADRISEFLVAWFGHEMEGKPGWDRLKAFLEGPLRRDLKNIALLDASMADGSFADGSEGDVAVAITLLFRERGYLRGTEWLDGESDELPGRIVARWMGLADTEPVPASLSFLANDRFEASMQAAWWSPVVRRLWKERAAESPELPLSEREELEKESPADLFGHLVLVDLLELRLRADYRGVVEVALACGVAPTETNGEWRPAEGRVAWPATAVRSRVVGGLLRHATWAVPDEDAQRARFGGVILSGKALASYAAWRSTLSVEHGSRWDVAIASLKPGEGLALAIAALPGLAEEEVDAEEGKRILLKALTAPK